MSAFSPTHSTSSSVGRERLVQELSQTLDVIEKLEDVLTSEVASPIGPVLVSMVTH